MNDLHNHTTFRRFYDEFNSIFVCSFCDYRRKDVGVRESIHRAKKDVKKRLFKEMGTGKENKKIIAYAYQTVCHDSRIIERALSYYRRMELVK